MANRLRNLKVDEGSLVDRGANPGAKVMLFKRDATAKADGDAATFDDVLTEREAYAALGEIGRMYETLVDSFYRIVGDREVPDKLALFERSVREFTDALGSVFEDGVEKVGRKISADRMKRIRAAYEALKTVMEEADMAADKKKQDDTQALDREKLDPAAKAALETAEKRATDAEAKAAELEKRVADLEKAAKPEPSPDDVLKSADPAVRKMIEDQAAELAEVKKAQAESDRVAKEERDRRETTEAIQKAERDYPRAGKAETLGPIVKRAQANALTAEDVVEIERVFKAHSDLVHRAADFRELGIRETGDSDVKTAAAEVQERAQKLASEKGWTIQKARTEVRRADRDLARRETAEQRPLH